VNVESVEVKKVLTRTGGFLRTVCSHSLQPYRGCAYGRSLCGAGCYVRHNAYVTRGRRWGEFLEARVNAAEAYRAEVAGERRYAARRAMPFSVFMSSATDPFQPQEARLGITRRVLSAMVDEPPDVLIVQTHSHRVVDHLDVLRLLAGRCALRVHLSVETDRDRIPGLPPPASSVESRLGAAARLRAAGLFTVVTVSPLLPIAAPDAFFARIAEVADAVVIDHYIEGDGTPDGRRTLRTPVPAACARLEPASTSLAYRDAVAVIARRHMAGRVGVNVDGFAGRYT
jgi:DNA repair photolyase